MAIINSLLISCLIFLGNLSFTGRNPTIKDCSSFEVSHRVEAAKNGKSTVSITASGGVSPYKYIFYQESGNLISNDFDSNRVGNLSKGKYFCTVADKTNCRKTVEFEIK